jgi:hypothetical protein
MFGRAVKRGPTPKDQPPFCTGPRARTVEIAQMVAFIAHRGQHLYAPVQAVSTVHMERGVNKYATDLQQLRSHFHRLKHGFQTINLDGLGGDK